MKNNEKIPVAKTVDEYLNRLPETTRATLEKMRKVIKAAAPMAEEKISYQIPGYVYGGPVAYFAAFKSHCSYFTTSHAIMKTFGDELKAYHTSGVTIHFPLSKPLPTLLVKKLVKAKLAENEARMAKKKKSAGARKKSRRRS
jgi:uncharacterized protein YdhG (YjbR/CyaY superfamily)